MNNFSFDGITKEYIRIVSRGRPYWADRNVNLLSVSGMTGAYVQSVDTEPIIIPITIRVEAETHEELIQRSEEIAEWLLTDDTRELVFEDMPNRSYKAMVNGSVNVNEIVTFGTVSFDFICPDGFKYGENIVAELPSDQAYLDYEGTEETYPIIEMEVLEPITLAMIQNQDEEYMMIGQPTEDDIETVRQKEIVFKEEGDTLDTWNTTPTKIDDWIGDITGEMGFDGTGIFPRNYGTGDKLHGPAIIREIPPIQDFEIETTFDIISNYPIDNYRMEIYFFDEGFNMLGKMGIHDNTKNFIRRRGLARVGEYENSTTRYVIGRNSYQYDNLERVSLMYLRVRRRGNRFTFYIAEIRNGRHYVPYSASYTDRTGKYTGRLQYIQLFIGNWKDRNRTFRTRANYINVYEFNEVTEDNTPYIAYEGDIITFDHLQGEIYINGENSKELKDFGSSYFPIKTGRNNFATIPDGALRTTLYYQERYK